VRRFSPLLPSRAAYLTARLDLWWDNDDEFRILRIEQSFVRKLNVEPFLLHLTAFREA
jgi:hypothetical protein